MSAIQQGSADRLAEYVPEEFQSLGDLQRELPRIAKDPRLIQSIETAISSVPSRHNLYLADSRSIDFLDPESIHLVLTSPPYWTLKEYHPGEGQLGFVADYEEFLNELDRVWQRCFDALVLGCRLICVVGDVCLSRRKNNGRHTVVPLHASIQEHCRHIGFDNLASIIGTAFREGAFDDSPRPFIGYLLLLEESEGSTRSVSVSEEHFNVFEEFQGASYARRCEETLRRLIRERSYDATALVLSESKSGQKGQYSEPAQDLCFEKFVTLMCGHVKAAYTVVAD